MEPCYINTTIKDYHVFPDIAVNPIAPTSVLYVFLQLGLQTPWNIHAVLFHAEQRKQYHHHTIFSVPEIFQWRNAGHQLLTG